MRRIYLLLLFSLALLLSGCPEGKKSGDVEQPKQLDVQKQAEVQAAVDLVRSPEDGTPGEVQVSQDVEKSDVQDIESAAQDVANVDSEYDSEAAVEDVTIDDVGQATTNDTTMSGVSVFKGCLQAATAADTCSVYV